MTLSFGFDTARDVLAKAERDLAALESAIAAQDRTEVQDNLYNFAVSVYHVRDWLIEHPGANYTPTDVNSCAQSSTAIQAFRDLATANKHRRITRYSPSTQEVTASVAAIAPLAAGSSAPEALFRMKIVASDGARHEAVALGKSAIAAWSAFFRSHGL